MFPEKYWGKEIQHWKDGHIPNKVEVTQGGWSLSVTPGSRGHWPEWARAVQAHKDLGYLTPNKRVGSFVLLVPLGMLGSGLMLGFLAFSHVTSGHVDPTQNELMDRNT